MDQIIQICKLKNFLYILFISFALISCSKGSDEQDFVKILDSEWQRGIDKNPLYASNMGDLKNNDKWPEYSLSEIHDNYEHNKQILDLLNKLNNQDFSDEANLNLELFKTKYIKSIDLFKFKSYLLPFSHRGGIQLQHESAETLPLREVKHYKDWLVRLNNIDSYINGHIEIAKEGINEGVMPPSILMHRVLDQISSQAFTDPKNSPFYKAFDEMHSSINQQDRLALQAEALQVIEEKVMPAYLN